MLCTMLEAATWALTAESGDQAAWAATLLCRNAGMLLFRQPPQGVDGDAAPGTSTAIVRKRFLLATSGKWEELVQAALDELEEDRRQPQPPRSAPDLPDPSIPLSEDILAHAAAKARVGGVRSAATILTGGASVPPGPETDAKIRELFYTAPTADPGPPPDEELRDAIAEVRRLHAKTKPIARPRAASLVASRLSGPAGPGPSGFRNSFIQLVCAQPQGPRILAQWVQPWTQGDVAPWVAKEWTHQLCRPFFKEDGIGIRPVMCGEALFKYAAACTVYAASRSLSAAMGVYQFGAGRSGGAALELAHVQAEVRAQPDRALVSLDVKNAFGCIQWAAALRIVTTLVPKLAHFLTAVWGVGHQRIWTQTRDPHIWAFMDAIGSLIQGGPEAHQIFCLVMAVILRDTGLRMPDPTTLLWAYVGDVTLHISLHHLCATLDIIAAAMRVYHCYLQPAKCHVCVPSLNSTPREDWPEELREAETRGFAVDHTSIPLLGSDAAAAHAVTLASEGTALAATVDATAKRAAKAVRLLECCHQLAMSNAPAGGRWPALCITRDIACRALSYDARVLPSSLVLPHASIVNECAWEVFEAVIGEDMSGPQRSQANLPTHLGGLSWPDLVDETILARLANVLEIGPHLREALRATRPNADMASIHALDGVDQEPDLLGAAALLGVQPGPSGMPAPQPTKDPLRAPAPARNLLSSYLQEAGQHRLRRLWSTMDAPNRTRLLSCGGLVAGQSLLAPPTTEDVEFDDADFRSLLRWRFGYQWPATACRNEPKDGGDRCNAPVAPDACHCMSCMIGPARYAIHHSISDRVCSFCAETGAVPRREVFVPEFVRSASVRRADEDDEHRKAAFLDVWAFGTPDVPDLLIDVTFRNAAAPRYAPAASQHEGATARRAAEEKQRRYPPSGGRRATTFAIESWGRLGAEGEAVLLTLRAAADRRDARTGHSQPGRLLRWRRQLDAIVQRGIARCLHSSLHGLPGRPPARHKPAEPRASLDPCPPAREALPPKAHKW